MTAIRIQNLYYLLLGIVFFLHACSQEGEVGPRGLQGTQILSGTSAPSTDIGIDGDFYFNVSVGDLYGPKTLGEWGNPFNVKGAQGVSGVPGVAGATGSAGANGKTILSGNVAPAMAQGNVGDFYINLATTEFYGPKNDSGWGGAINLKGLAGTTIHNGNAAPTNSIGNLGDYYLEKNNGLLYGPKTVSGWGTPLNLVGAKGSNGTDGSNGLDGATILSGATVPSTTQGKLGDFYFRLGVGDFYGPKSASGWGNAFNLRGANGTNGAPGTQILSGTTAPDVSLGQIGDFYFNKSTAEFYGPKSANNWGGPILLRGSTGATGATGSAGSQIITRIYGPMDTIGVVGDYFINSTSGEFFGPKSSSGWGSSIFNMRSGQVTDVIYSDWIKIGDLLSDRNTNSLYTDISVPVFMYYPEYVDNSSIVVYAKERSTSSAAVIVGVFQLNYTSLIWGNQLTYSVWAGNIRIYTSVDTKIGLKNSHEFRYVIIPGNKKAMLATTVPKNYNDFKVLYNIPN